MATITDQYLLSEQNEFKGREGFCDFLSRYCNITQRHEHRIVKDIFFSRYRIFARLNGYSIAKPINISRFLGRLGVRMSPRDTSGHGKELEPMFVGILYESIPKALSHSDRPPDSLTSNTCDPTTTPNHSSTPTPSATVSRTTSNHSSCKSRTRRRILFTGEKNLSEFLSKQFEITGNKEDRVTKLDLHLKYKKFCIAQRCLAASSFNIGMYLGRLGVETEVTKNETTGKGKVCVYIGMRSINSNRQRPQSPLPTPQPLSSINNPDSSSSSSSSSVSLTPQTKQSSSITELMNTLHSQASEPTPPLEQCILEALFNDLETSNIISSLSQHFETVFQYAINTDPGFYYLDSTPQEDNLCDAEIRQLISQSTHSLEKFLLGPESSMIDAVLTDTRELSIPE